MKVWIANRASALASALWQFSEWLNPSSRPGGCPDCQLDPCICEEAQARQDYEQAIFADGVRAGIEETEERYGEPIY